MEGDIRLLVVGATVPPPTREALSARGIRPLDDAGVERSLETAGNDEVDCVLVDPRDGDAPDPSRFADAVAGAIVAVSDGPPSAADLEAPVTAVVRESDLRNRGAVVANRIHTATAAADRTTGEGGEDCGPLKRAAEALSAVQTIETDPDRDVTATIERILETAADRLEYPIGYATRIEDGVQEVVAAVGDHEHIQPGATDPLGRTYCRRTVEADEPIVLENAPEQGWDGDPAVERFGLRCYVGARVAVDDEVYGTLCFADERAREGLDVEIQGSVVEALASRVGYELERGRYEAELAERESRLRSLFEEAPDGILVHDTDGEIADANRAAADLLGYSRSELTSMNVLEIEVGHDADALLEGWETMPADGTFTFEGVHRREDGTTYPAEVWVNDFEAGDERRFVAMIRDISERKQRERELERYQRLWNNLPVGVCRVDPAGDGRFLDVNRRLVEMAGADSEEELLERPLTDFWPGLEDGELAFDRVLNEGSVEVERRFEMLDGRTIWGRLTVIVREWEGEEFLDVVVQDVTERKRREHELEEQRDNLEILNEVVRHDIRNDLQLVQAYAKMLEEHVDAEGAEHLEIVRESAENAIALTTTARDLAEVMLRTDGEDERVPLAATLEGELSEIRSTYPDAAVTLERSPPSVEVVGNDMLGAVFRNLLKNAVQHNDKEVPAVTVEATVRDGEAEVRIADNGPGVPDAQKEEIFGKGEKGLESEGSGIGLYLVRQVVEEYGGEVRVEDNDPEGAVFVVRLPVAE